MNKYGDHRLDERNVDADVSRFETLLAALGLSVIAGAIAAAVLGGDTLYLQLFRVSVATIAAFGAGALLWEAVRWEKPEEQRPAVEESASQRSSTTAGTRQASRAA